MNFFRYIPRGAHELCFLIGLTERAVLPSYKMFVPARLHDQCTGAKSQSEIGYTELDIELFITIYGPS